MPPESSIEPKEKPKGTLEEVALPAKSPRGTRLPLDWKPSESDIAYCRKRRPDLDPVTVAEVFANHWHAKPGKDGRKLDWVATWQNWVLRESTKAKQSADSIFGAGSGFTN
jgi:hypothetical protein